MRLFKGKIKPLLDILRNPISPPKSAKKSSIFSGKASYARCLFLICTVLYACTQNPVTGKNELAIVTETQEVSLGEEYYGYMQQAQGGPYVADPEVEKYVQKVGYKLVAVSDRPHLPYEFVVLNHSTPNAWALPGGKIAINRGLLVELKNEAELAAVLAHEIVHSAARHGAQSMQRQLLVEMGLAGLGQVFQGRRYEDLVMRSAELGGGLIHLKYSRTAELEADAYGIKYMVKAGYDPQAAVDLQKTFLRLSKEHSPHWLEGLFATHPPSQDRIDANEKTIAPYPRGGYLGAKEYAAQMEHLIRAQPAYAALDKGYAALVEEKNPQEALRYAQEGIAIEPREAHLYNLAGKAKKSLAAFQKAVELNPRYFDFHLQLGLLEQQLGHTLAAQAHLEESMALFPTAEAQEVLHGIGAASQAEPSALIKNLLDIQGRWNGNKNLVLTIWNRSASPLYKIVIEVALYDTAPKPLLRRKIEVPEAIEPGRWSCIVTDIVQPAHASWMETEVRQAKIYR